MIKIEKISKYFKSFKALNEISFDILENEIVALLGPNGSGKTTLIRILTGFLPASSGSAYINNFDIFDDIDKVKSIIGYLPENPPLYQEMSVKSYLEFVANIKKVEKKSINRKINEVIEVCDLHKEKFTTISNLSKGFKQRVGIAGAIINDPLVLILDEPTSSLDPNQIIEIRNLILRLKKKSTILIATHILSEASLLSDKIIIMNEGNLLAVDSKENLSKNLNEENQYLIKTDIDNFSKIKEIFKDNIFVRFKIKSENSSFVEFVFYNDDKNLDKEKILTIFIQNKIEFNEFKKFELDLEDIFVKYTKEKFDV